MSAIHRSFMTWKRCKNLGSLRKTSNKDTKHEKSNLCCWTDFVRERRVKQTDLRAENSNGVLGTERDETRGSPRNVIDHPVASCSYEHSLRFDF